MPALETGTKERRPTAGARALVAYLARTKQSITAFCAAHDLDRVQVQRAINGERTRISVDFARAIEEATGGAVRCQLWASNTARAA